MSELKKILGNRHNIEHFKEAVRKGKVSHAYIIDGPEGIGKKTFAGYIAAALLCEKGIEEGPCMVCGSCVKADTHNHPDIIWVEHDKPTVLSIDEIRQQVIDTVDIVPYYGPYKIYIIKDAQLLNDNGQNALLKTLEEPPEYALFFLLTDNYDRLLDTIKSRCMKLRMEPLDQEIIIRELGKKHTIILSSHLLSEVQAVCDKILIINKGRIVADELTSSLTGTGSSTEKLRLIVEGRKQQVQSVLQKVDGVVKVTDMGEAEKGCCEFTVDSRRDVRRLIFRALAKTDFSILEMSPVEQSLEDTYLNIITGKNETKEEATDVSDI